MKILLLCFSALACIKSVVAYTYVTNVIDDIECVYRIDGNDAVLLRAELSESVSSGERKNVLIPKTIAGTNVRAVADDAFKASPWLRSVTIQGSVTQIGNNAFANCSNLVSVIIRRDGESYGLHCINSFAFCNCVSLSDINLPDAVNLSMIDRSVFAGCTSLNRVELPPRCYLLGEFAFEGCMNLEEVSFPATLDDVSGSAFIGCVRLHEIKIAPGGNYLFENGILYDKSKSQLIRCLVDDQVDTVKIEEGVTVIMTCAFDGCRHLKNVMLPSTLKHIGNGAFADTGLKELVLPEGLESVGYAAFANTSVKLSGKLVERVESGNNQCGGAVVSQSSEPKPPTDSRDTIGIQQAFETCQFHRAWEVCIRGDGRELPFREIGYFMNSKDRESLKPGLETWRQAGFGGLKPSAVEYALDVRLSFKCMNSAPTERPSDDLIESCDVNLTDSATVLNVIRRNGSSRFVRDSTPADKSFRQFLVDLITKVNPLKPVAGPDVIKP